MNSSSFFAVIIVVVVVVVVQYLGELYFIDTSWMSLRLVCIGTQQCKGWDLILHVLIFVNSVHFQITSFLSRYFYLWNDILVKCEINSCTYWFHILKTFSSDYKLPTELHFLSKQVEYCAVLILNNKVINSNSIHAQVVALTRT